MHVRPFVQAFSFLLAGSILAAQQIPTAQQAQELYREIPGLMEASAIVVPELARASAPLTENVKQSSKTLLSGPSRDHVGLVYTLLTNAKVYLQLVDALPKPMAFSDEVRRQVDILRLQIDQLDSYFRSLLVLRQEQLRGADRDNLERYSEDNQNLLAPSVNEQRIVFFGDSITDFWQLEQFFPGKPYVNRGISGQITGQMLGRMQADVIELQPKVMILLAGTNDLAHGVSLTTIQNNIRMIADLAKAHGIHPVLATLLPVSDYHQEADPRNKRTTDRPPGDIIALNTWLKRFAETHDFIFLDYHQSLVDQQGMLRRDLADDGLHPNVEGYKVMTPLADQAIAAALAKNQKQKRRGLF